LPSWRRGQGYAGLAKEGYDHHAVSISGSGDLAHVVMPGDHKIASLLKRRILGTDQDSVTAKHPDAYLDEFAFQSQEIAPPGNALLSLAGKCRRSAANEVSAFKGLPNNTKTQPVR